MGDRLIISDNREDPGNPLVLDGEGISGQQGFERTLKAFMLLPALIRLSEHFLLALWVHSQPRLVDCWG